MAELYYGRRDLDCGRDLRLIMQADVDNETKGAMMRELARELMEDARRIRQCRLEVEAERRGEEAPGKPQHPAKLLRRLRHQAGALAFDHVDQEPVSAPIQAGSDLAALFDLIHDAGGRLPEKED